MKQPSNYPHTGSVPPGFSSVNNGHFFTDESG